MGVKRDIALSVPVAAKSWYSDVFPLQQSLAPTIIKAKASI